MLGALTQILCFQLVGEATPVVWDFRRARGPRHAPAFLPLTLRGGASANLQTTSQTPASASPLASCRRERESSSICTGSPTSGCRPSP